MVKSLEISELWRIHNADADVMALMRKLRSNVNRWITLSGGIEFLFKIHRHTATSKSLVGRYMCISLNVIRAALYDFIVMFNYIIV